jgi:hypothetical protein
MPALDSRTSKTLVRTSATIEALTGIALIAAPDLLGRLLLGVGFDSSGIAVARLTGVALLCLAIACWTATAQAVRALFTYNFLAGLYLGYLRVGGGFVGHLLWPVCVLHLLLAIVFLHPAIDGILLARTMQSHPPQATNSGKELR